MKIEDIKVGDRIYQTRGLSVLSFYNVSKITKTQIVCDNTRFKINSFGGLSLIGAGTWSLYSYEIETPELKDIYERGKAASNLKNRINKLSLSKLSMDDLNKINLILSKYE